MQAQRGRRSHEAMRVSQDLVWYLKFRDAIYPFSEVKMPQPNAILFYVVDIARSSKFYADLLDLKPTVASPFYVMFKLDNGFEFAIYDRNKLQPPAAAMSASAELCFIVQDSAALDALHGQWVQKGIEIIMAPTKMYFGGIHFMGLDPDGHRLRAGTPD
jgi:catechol 2,3-dioxygenase-like lactoylglutathione lyase family enzyme